jgi:hypothetical protein
VLRERAEGELALPVVDEVGDVLPEDPFERSLRDRPLRGPVELLQLDERAG